MAFSTASIDKVYQRYRWWYYRHRSKFVFIHINKCGGSSVEQTLGIPFAHRTAASYIDALGEAWWAAKFSFSFVRNPWDKVVSHYHYRVKTNQTNLRDKPISFHEWVAHTYRDKNLPYYDNALMFSPQKAWLTNKSGDIVVDFVGRFENFNSDFQSVCQRIGRKNARLKHVKSSSRTQYQDYYTPETKKIVGDAFAEDIDLFGYDF